MLRDQFVRSKCPVLHAPHYSVSPNLARLRDQHSFLHRDSLAADRRSRLRPPSHPHASEAVSGVRVSDRHKRGLHGVRDTGYAARWGERVMRHRFVNVIPRYAMLLLLGAIINIAIAWGFALRVDVSISAQHA